MSQLLISSVSSPIGKLNLIARQDVLLAAGFSATGKLLSSLSQSDRELTSKKVKSIKGINNLIVDYFDGDLNALHQISVSQPGGEFSQRAWKSMRKVNAGKTISYAQLAKQAGSEAAVRAAGSACAKNLIAIVVPCHRIVKTGGALGNYAYGLKSKEWLLSHEGAL